MYYSGIDTQQLLRAPKDVETIASVLHLTQEQARAAVSSNCQRLLQRSALRKLRNIPLEIVDQTQMSAGGRTIGGIDMERLRQQFDGPKRSHSKAAQATINAEVDGVDSEWKKVKHSKEEVVEDDDENSTESEESTGSASSRGSAEGECKLIQQKKKRKRNSEQDGDDEHEEDDDFLAF